MLSITRRAFLGSGSFLLLPPAFADPLPSLPFAKAGLAGPPPAASGLRPDWTYDWDLDYLPGANPQLPMCWGWKGDATRLGLQALRGHEIQVLFGFNEPDHPDQSNLEVQTAIEAWPALQGIAAELVGPSCADPLGPWMQGFIAAAERGGLRLDSVGVHAYGPPEPERFIKQLERVYNLYGRPIWVTEFAVADWTAQAGVRTNRYTAAQTGIFMNTVCDFMDRTSWVRGYAWFPWDKPQSSAPLFPSIFFDQGGRLTELGEAYARRTSPRRHHRYGTFSASGP